MIISLALDEPTGGDRVANANYKAWIDDPKYLKVVDLDMGKYKLAILPDRRVELRTQRDRVEHGVTVRRQEIISTYTIDNDYTIDGWVMISWMYCPKTNQEWNEALQRKIISTYREETACQSQK